MTNEEKIRWGRQLIKWLEEYPTQTKEKQKYTEEAAYSFITGFVFDYEEFCRFFDYRAGWQKIGMKPYELKYADDWETLNEYLKYRFALTPTFKIREYCERMEKEEEK